MRGRCKLVFAAVFLPLAGFTAFAAADDPLAGEAQAAMRKAAAYYREQVAAHGGYVYYTSADLKQRWGEGVASPDQIFVQPPGTPTVGMAYLAAYKATGDKFYLDAAREAGAALIHGQLDSGGWTQVVDFDPKGSKVAQYRNGKGRGKEQLDARRRHQPVGDSVPGEARPGAGVQGRGSPRSRHVRARCAC